MNSFLERREQRVVRTKYLNYQYMALCVYLLNKTEKQKDARLAVYKAVFRSIVTPPPPKSELQIL
jgi:hypothetical protein